jgi:hypothetical protein
LLAVAVLVGVAVVVVELVVVFVVVALVVILLAIILLARAVAFSVAVAVVVVVVALVVVFLENPSGGAAEAVATNVCERLQAGLLDSSGFASASFPAWFLMLRSAPYSTKRST